MNIRQSAIGTTVLLGADLLWIKLYMGNQYKSQVRRIQGKDMKLNPLFGVLAYLLMIIGLNLFVLPNIRNGYELEDSIKYGFTFGVILYGVYDFTAGAILSSWDKRLAVIDVLWGGLVYFIAAYSGSSL